MINILIAPDKFKGSLTTFDVCNAIEEGLLQACTDFVVTKCPMADGGDGLSDVIAYYTGATKLLATVQNPLGKPIQAEWLLSADGKTAFIEMATASGLSLLQRSEYNPLQTSTYGTGQLIKAALGKGVNKIILGIGGSATNDGGLGMATALGYRFLNKEGYEVPPVGASLGIIERIDCSQSVIDRTTSFVVACDVKNPLLGKDGAAAVYAPQKGADAAMVKQLETGTQHFAALLKKELQVDVASIPGSGAAGGMGAGSVAFLGAELLSGIDLVMQYAGFEQRLTAADIVITGEGKIDEQTLQGKVVMGVASHAKKQNKKLIALCGGQSIAASELSEFGVSAVFPVVKYPMSWEEAKRRAYQFVSDTAFSVGNLLVKK